VRAFEPVAIVEPAAPESPVCDFCNAPKPRFAYPVGEITVGAGADQTTIPAADWNACADCHQLIADEDWEGLAVHAGYPRGYSATPVTVFRRHRRGSAVC
jgi:hypothetical protein